MKSFAIIFVLIQTCSLLCLCSNIEDYIHDPIQQCSANFRDECMDRTPPGNTICGNNLICRLDPAQLVVNHHECYKTCAYKKPVTFHGITFFEDICARCTAAMTGDGTSMVTPGTFHDFVQIRSPGYFAYSPNTICNYHVRCEEGQSMMFEIIKHDLQPRENGKCLDSLFVHNTLFPFDTKPTCGDLSTLSPRQRYLFSDKRMFVSFTTNAEKEFEGFVALARCVSNRANFGSPGCVHFDAPRGTGGRKRRSFRVPHFTVKPGQVVRYKDYTLTVESISDGQRIIYKFENILVLQTYNQFEEFVTYKINAVNREFPGFGKLQIGYGIAHYIQTDINPAFIPSSEERRRISVLAGGLFELGFFNDDVFRLIDPGTPTNGSGGATGSPPPDPCVELLAQGELRELADKSRNACNGFVRATVDSFMRIVEECRRNFTPPTGPVTVEPVP